MQESLHTAVNAGIATYGVKCRNFYIRLSIRDPCVRLSMQESHAGIHTAFNAGIATYGFQCRNRFIHTAFNAGIATYGAKCRNRESLQTALKCSNHYIRPPCLALISAEHLPAHALRSYATPLGLSQNSGGTLRKDNLV